MNEQQREELLELIEQYGSACESMGHGWGCCRPLPDTLLLQIKDKLEALESPKTPLEASEKLTQGVGSQEVEKALTEAYGLGKRYWAYADSEETWRHKLSDQTYQKFRALVRNFCSKFN
jgi:hypothetical protein